MSAVTLRKLLRWSHVAIGLMIGTYIFSPLHLDPTATLMARLSLVPLLTATGVAMWQQGRLSRIFAKRTARRHIQAVG